MYRVIFDKKVLKFLEKHKWEFLVEKLREIITILKENPYKNNLDIKILKWTNWFYRLRVWKYRFIYEIIDKELIIRFINSDKRWDIY